MMKVNGIVQWTKCNRNNRFMNMSSLPWQPETSRVVHLALLGLTAGRQVDGIQVNFKILKFTVHRNS